MPAEPPIVIENRKTLTYLLCEAAELEHGLMCEYLYAAFSLKTEPDETLAAEHLDTVERWRSVVLAVAAEEMLHWALVNNLLTAVGSAPYVARPHMPHQAKGYPAGVQLALVPFGERALRHFLFLERPEGMELADAEGFDPSGPALPIMGPADIVPWGQEFHTVGHLYRSIQAGIDNLAAKLGEQQLFIGPAEAQATPESFGWPQLVAITDAASASRSDRRDRRAGRGCPGRLERGALRPLPRRARRAAGDQGGPTRRSNPLIPSSAAGVRPVDGVHPDVVITDPITAAVSDLFNVNYDLILQILVRFFANVGEDRDAARRARATPRCI